jgi:hypothetical protein
VRKVILSGNDSYRADELCGRELKRERSSLRETNGNSILKVSLPHKFGDVIRPTCERSAGIIVGSAETRSVDRNKPCSKIDERSFCKP